MGIKDYLTVAFVVIALFVMMFVYVSNYEECKNNGFTTMYCMTGK